jgi:predicted DNA binding CopG/RHH family protein
LDQTFLNVRLACAGEYERITIRLDKDVLDWFRQQATVQGGGNYQTAINQVLKEYIYSHQPPLEELLRRVVREELEHYKTE